VTSPEKRSDASSALGRLAGKKYVAFAVAYRAEGLPAFAAVPAGAPRRRFRDFVALAARLVRAWLRAPRLVMRGFRELLLLALSLTHAPSAFARSNRRSATAAISSRRGRKRSSRGSWMPGAPGSLNVCQLKLRD